MRCGAESGRGAGRAVALLLGMALLHGGPGGCAAGGDGADVVAAGEPCDFDALTTAAVPATPGALPVGDFRVALATDGSWDVTHADETDRILFRVPGAAGLRALRTVLKVVETQGALSLSEAPGATCPASATATLLHDGRRLVFRGVFQGVDPACAGLSWEARICQPAAHHLSVEIGLRGGEGGALALGVASDVDERVFGLGEQFPRDTLDLKGRVIPVVVQEQGIGRGEPGISETMELLSPGSSGSEVSTYHAVPQVLTSLNRGFFLENTETSFFDLTAADRIDVRVHSDVMRLRVLHGTSPLELVQRFTEFAGRMRPPPTWIDEGAIVALARDLDLGLQKAATLRQRGARIAAVWNQTWCGTATTMIGEQVLWNWALSPAREAPWGAYVDALQTAGARVVCYVNPMFRDLPADADPGTRNLFREAVDGGFVVRTAAGGTYLLQQGVFEVALLDLSNPDARVWMKSVLRDEVLGRARCSGWMADFAEALPFDAVLASGEPAAAWHNRYPVEWARLHREALEEAGRLDDVLVFHRSGFTTTPTFSGMQWEGDQAVTWDRFDGIRSALHGLLNGAFSGIALNHSDAGGYTGVPIGDPPVERAADLLQRWVEMNAFTALLRTHEGNQPARNAQVYGDDVLAEHFARFTRVYAALAPYRRALYQEAAAKGWPVVRPLAMHAPEVDRAWTISDQFLLGADVLVAPVLDPCGDVADCALSRSVWLPPGEWRHLWTGATHGTAGAATGTDVTVPAPLGQPPVFLRVGSGVAASLPDALRAQGIAVP
jgi:alpha-glucosidase